MLRRYACRAAVAALVAAGSLLGCSREKTTLYFFYEAVCPSCEESSRMVNLANRVAFAVQQSRREEVEIYDVFRGDATKKLEEVSAKHGVSWEKLSLPVLFASGKVYSGEKEVLAYLASRKG